MSPRRTLASRSEDLDHLSRITISELSEQLERCDISAEEVSAWSLDRTESAHKRFNCGTSNEAQQRWRERAELAAAEAGKRQRKGRRKGALDGIPLHVKDNWCVAGEETSCASEILAGWPPPFSGAAVEKLEDCGAVLAGRSNMDEFGMGSATAFSRYGPVLNPWSPTASPPAGSPGGRGWAPQATDLSAGGSSGGAACLVSCGASFGGLGSDTGGSVRQPAAWCGVVGFKPSYGRVSRHGLVAYASSMDTPGVVARSVLDAALLTDALASTAPDRRDANSMHAPPHPKGKGGVGPLASAAGAVAGEGCLQGLVVGVPRAFHVAELHGPALEAWKRAAGLLEDLGAEVVPVGGLESIKFALPAYYILACAEAHSNLARYDGLRYGPGSSGESLASLRDAIESARSAGLGEEVQRRVLCGAYVLGASAYDQYYRKAIQVREQLVSEFATAFEAGADGRKRVDVLLTPTAPLPPLTLRAALASALPDSDDRDDGAAAAEVYVNDVMTVPANLASLPALSLPVDTTSISIEGQIVQVPVGMQLLGRTFDEATVLRVGSALEATSAFKRPPHVTAW